MINKNVKCWQAAVVEEKENISGHVNVQAGIYHWLLCYYNSKPQGFILPLIVFT